MRSRSHIFELYHIEDEEMKRYLDMVINSESFEVEDSAKEFLVNSSSGDARAMLNLLESGISIESPLRVETLSQIRRHATQIGSSEDVVGILEESPSLLLNIKGITILGYKG